MWLFASQTRNVWFVAIWYTAGKRITVTGIDSHIVSLSPLNLLSNLSSPPQICWGSIWLVQLKFINLSFILDTEPLPTAKYFGFLRSPQPYIILSIVRLILPSTSLRSDVSRGTANIESTYIQCSNKREDNTQKFV